jgi:hypothetical protein
VTVINPISIFLIVCILVYIYNIRQTVSEKLMTTLVLILCVQVVSHVLAFLLVKQTVSEVNKVVIERLLNELN